MRLLTIIIVLVQVTASAATWTFAQPPMDGSGNFVITNTLSASVLPGLTGDVTTTAGTTATTLTIHPFVWSGNTGNALVGAGVTCYYAPCGNSFTNILTTDTSAATRNVTTHTVTLSSLYVVMNPAAGSGKTDTATVMTNGIASSIVVNLANVTAGSDTTHTETVVAGVEVGIRIVTAASSTASKFSWSLEGK